MLPKRKVLQETALPTSAPDEYHIISVSPFAEDHGNLESLACSLRGMTHRWRLFTARDLGSTIEALRRVIFPVIVCERRLAVGGWKDLLQHLQLLAWPPPLIVTSVHADDRLWAEALNLGAYDVLAKPLDWKEAARVIQLACLRSRPDRTAAAKIPSRLVVAPS